MDNATNIVTKRTSRFLKEERITHLIKNNHVSEWTRNTLSQHPLSRKPIGHKEANTKKHYGKYKSRRP